MPRFWDPSFKITRKDDGTIYMEQTEPLGDYPRAMPDRLVHWAETAPDRPYLNERDGDGWRTLSYAQTLQQVRRLGAGLLKLELGPDRPLLILSGNSVDHALLGLAAQYVGVPYAPLSVAYSLVSTDHAKLKDIVNLLTPGAVYAADGQAFSKALAAIEGNAHWVLVTDNPNDEDEDLTLEELARLAEPETADEAYRNLTPDTVAKYLFTSGSTGSPKAVINTQKMLNANQAMVTDCFRFHLDHPPVVLEWAPWNHTAGGNKVFNMVLTHGGTYYIDDGKPTPDLIGKTLRNIKEVRPTWFFNVPVGYDMMVRELEKDAELREAFFGRLDMMMYAGAGLAQHSWDALKRMSRETVGHEVLITTGLGSTETAPFALMCTTPQEKPGNVGLPSRGLVLKLVPNGGKLEARIKGPSIMPGYYRDPGKTAESFDEEGFYMFGDALRPADPDDLTQGFYFDGRTAENFKLSTGTWVAVGALRAATVDAFGGLVQDAVIIGENRPFLGALLVPDWGAMRALAGEKSHEELAKDPVILSTLQERLNAFAKAATGSATRIKAVSILTAPPELDKGEVTDKGSLNQRAMRTNRSEDAEKLYSDNPTVLRAK